MTFINYKDKIFLRQSIVVLLICQLLTITTPLTAYGNNTDEETSSITGLICYEDEYDDIGNDCHILELYNQTLVDEITFDNYTKYLELANICSCRLILMKNLWEDCYYKDDITRVGTMVNNVIQDRIEEFNLKNNDNQNKNQIFDNYPEYLWSDIEFAFYQISIHTATKDFFLKEKDTKFKPKHEISSLIKTDPTYVLIKKACFRIAKDTSKLYRYLENLNRLSPQAFFEVIAKAEYIEIVYQASKACKLLVLMNLKQYRLKPINTMLVPVFYDNALKEKNIRNDSNISLDVMQIYEEQQNDLLESNNQFEEDNYNNLVTDINNNHDNNNSDDLIIENWNNKTIDHNLQLKSASIYLSNCSPWQKKKFSIKELELECPMMMTDDNNNSFTNKKVPNSWLENHSTIWSRSQMAVKCACQLLLHNQTWPLILEDNNVQVMATALTNYLNENRIPDFMSTPLKAINGWFEKVMERFKLNRKLTIKEIIKTKFNQEDPTIVMKKQYSEDALELLRRGCNYIMFNYNKGSQESKVELKLIRYLDNLQMFSPDKLFTFELILHDPNLFKLNALSKICKPIVYA